MNTEGGYYEKIKDYTKIQSSCMKVMRIKTHHGSLAVPLYQTSTFSFETASQGEDRFSGAEEGNIYSRLGNPTVRVLEERMTALENGEGTLAFGSGMAAVSAILVHLTKSGDHIVCPRGIYGCTFGLLGIMERKYNIKHDLIRMATEEEIEQAIKPETVCIYIETPINPTMELVDLAGSRQCCEASWITSSCR